MLEENIPQIAVHAVEDDALSIAKCIVDLYSKVKKSIKYNIKFYIE